MKVSGKERQRQSLSGYSATPVAYRAPHEIRFVGCYRYEYGKHGATGEQPLHTGDLNLTGKHGATGEQQPHTGDLNLTGKHGATGEQRPPTHLIWLRLSIDWNGSEQT